MSHDADKLIRQLSLVAFLMAERRLLTARDVKSNVEGYSEMSDEAFARRFYSDRAELTALGVPLQSQRDEFTGEELYTLRSENYFLDQLDLDDDELAAGLLASGTRVGDPLWRMPLWPPYDKLLKSNIADVNHIAEGSHAGSVMAALFLKRFVNDAKRFAHLDIFGWVPREQPGRPQGGEPQGSRALFAYFRQEFGP